MIVTVEAGDELPPPDELAEDLMQAGYPIREIKQRIDGRAVTVWQIVDQVVVERVLAGERLPTNVSERREILRLARRRGISMARFERLGWRPERYLTDVA